jgi:hypothetical protein
VQYGDLPIHIHAIGRERLGRVLTGLLASYGLAAAPIGGRDRTQVGLL